VLSPGTVYSQKSWKYQSQTWVMTYEDLLSLSETNLKRKFLRDGVVDRCGGEMRMC
jgi:hypothetical protein